MFPQNLVKGQQKTSVAKNRKANSNIFAIYFEEIQEKVAKTWRIPPEVVEEHKDIESF
jgi:hypothetical protein